jgi:hypothetical protein
MRVALAISVGSAAGAADFLEQAGERRVRAEMITKRANVDVRERAEFSLTALLGLF